MTKAEQRKYERKMEALKLSDRTVSPRLMLEALEEVLAEYYHGDGGMHQDTAGIRLAEVAVSMARGTSDQCSCGEAYGARPDEVVMCEDCVRHDQQGRGE